MISLDSLISLFSTRKIKTLSHLTWLPYPIQRLLSNMPLILFVNWLFQGVLGMQSKEIVFRLGIYLMLLLPALSIPPMHSLNLELFLAALLCVHTLNWLFNGNFWVCVRYSKLYYLNPIKLIRYRERIFGLIRSQPWLLEAVVLGSTAKNLSSPSPYSDIDLRIIFPAGITSWLKVNLLLLRLRASALFHRIPLDVYAYNDIDKLSDFNPFENVLIVVDRASRLRSLYQGRSITST